MVEVDRRQRAVDRAGLEHRTTAAKAIEELWQLEGRLRSNPVTLFKSLKLGASVRIAERKAEKIENKAGEFFDLLTRHDESEVVSRFYGGVQERAGVHGMVEVAESIESIRSLSVPSLYEIYGSPLWYQQPPAARAMVEIALAITESQKKRKGKRDVTLGKSVTNTSAISDIYKLLGLEAHIQNIPSMPPYGTGFGHRTPVRLQNVGDHGLDLFFTLYGARPRTAYEPPTPTLIHPKITLDIRARKKAA